MSIPNFVKVVEVGPRDGLQNEKSPVSTDTKVEPVNRLSETGFVNVKVTSFVSSKWVPAMADGVDVTAHIQRRSGTLHSVLIPSMKGFEGAAAAGVDGIVIFSAVSEAFVQKNINCTIAESIERFVPVAKAVKDVGIHVYGSISCPLGCPRQDEVPVSSVVDVIKHMADLGCDEIDIADTIGVGTAGRAKTTMEAAAAMFPIDRLSGHLHDTYGQALANILTSLEVGIAIFHASVVRLDGCPYAKGVTGNVAIEDVLYLLRDLGIHTGINLDKVVLVGDFTSQAIGRLTASRASRTLLLRLQDQIAQACIRIPIKNNDGDRDRYESSVV